MAKADRRIVETIDDFRELALTEEFTAVALIACRDKGEPEQAWVYAKHRPQELLGAVEQFCIEQHRSIRGE